MKNIKKIIGYFINRERKCYYTEKLIGVDVRVLKNTIRTKVDQDDAWFFHLAKNAETIFDIGSNTGYMSLLAAIQPNIQKIILVDPNPEALAKASQNLIINGFGYKTKFISAFMGDKDGEKIKFYTVGTGAAGSMFKGHAETAAAMNSSYMVEQLTIDALVEQVKFVPSLIKIDIEGAESFALKGAVKTASFGKSKFMIEMHSPPELPMIENATRVISWCEQNKYKAFYMKEGRQILNSDPIALRGKCHLLLLPDGETYPEYLREIPQGGVLPNSVY